MPPLLSSLFRFPVSAEYVAYSPFTSELKIKNVKLGYDDEPFVEGKEGSCKIDNLFGLVLGNINFSDIKLDDVTFRAVRNEKGKWNFPWLSETYGKLNLIEPVVNLNLKNIEITNGKVLFEIKREKPDISSNISFYRLNLNCPVFANNNQTNINYNGLFKISGRDVKINAGRVSGKISSYFDEWTIPESLISEFNINEIEGGIAGLNFKDNNVKLYINICSEGPIYRIEKLTFQEKHENAVKSDISISGNYNSTYDFLDFNIEANPVSPEIISLFFNTFTEYSFGKMKLYYTGNFNVNRQNLSNRGILIVNDFQISRNDEKDTVEIVPYDISLDYSLDYDFNRQILNLERLNSFFSKNLINQHDKFASSNVKKALMLDVSDPINISFKNNYQSELAGNKSSGLVTLNNLDIRFLNSILVDLPEIELGSGMSSGTFGFDVIPDENSIEFKGKFNTKDFSFKIGNYYPGNIQVTEDFKCTLQDFRKLNIDSFNFRLLNQNGKVLNSTLEGYLDFFKQEIGLSVFTPLLTDGIIEYLPNRFAKNRVFKGITDQLKPFNIDTKLSLYLNKLKREGEIGNASIKFDTFQYKDIILELNNLIPFSWDKKGFTFNKNIKTEINIKNLDTKLLNVFLPDRSKFSFTKGIMDTSYKCLFEREPEKLKIDGKVNIPEFGVKINNRELNNLDLNALYHVYYSIPENKFTFSKSNIILDINSENALSLEASGSLLPDNDNFTLNANIFNINKQIFNLFSNIYISNITRLKGFGKLNLKHTENIDMINTNLNLIQMEYVSPYTNENIIPFDKGSVVLKCKNSNDKLNIEKAEFEFIKNNKNVLNLNLDGSIPSDIYSDRIILNLTSSLLYVKSARQLIEAFIQKKSERIIKNKPEKLTEVDKNKSLEGIKLKGVIKLKNVHYNQVTQGKIDTVINIDNNKLLISPITINLNKSIIDGYIDFNFMYEDVCLYSFKLKSNLIPIQTLLGVFGISTNEVGGNIQKAEIEINGTDAPFSDSKYKQLKGKLTINADDITLPVKFSEYKIFKIMFIPLEVLGRIRHMIPSGLAPDSIMNTINSTSNIFKNLQTVHLENAEIYLKASNNIQLDKILFTGGHEDLIKFMEFTGIINLNKEVKIKAYSNIGGLKFPIEIYGTIDNPETSYHSFAYQFMKDNTINILNPVNLFDFVVDIGKGIKNTITGTAKFIVSPLKH